MGKLLLLLIGVGLVYFILRNYARRLKAGADSTVRGTENMVRCHHCGLNLPLSEAIGVDGRHFCCPEHARQHRS